MMMMMMMMMMQEKQDDASLTELQRQVTTLHDELEKQRKENAAKLHQVIKC